MYLVYLPSNQLIFTIMNKIPVFILFFWSLTGLSQTQLPTEKGIVNIEVINSNILYVGINNKVRINIEGYNNEKLSITAPGCTVKHFTKDVYDIGIPKSVPKVMVHISTKQEDGTSIVLAKKEFPVMRLSNPIPVILQHNENTISRNKLKEAKKIDLKHHNPLFHVDFKIAAFTCTVIDKNNQYKVIDTTNDAYFTEKILEAIANPDYTKIIFEQITAYGPGNRIRHMSPLIFDIRD